MAETHQEDHSEKDNKGSNVASTSDVSGGKSTDKPPQKTSGDPDKAATKIQRAYREMLQSRRRSLFQRTLGLTPSGRHILRFDGLYDNLIFKQTPKKAPNYQKAKDGSGKSDVMELGTLSSYGERGFDKTRQQMEYDAAMHHEAIHRVNHKSDPVAYQKRLKTDGEHGGWSTMEEQFTIEGVHPANPQKDQLPKPYTTENQVRSEMGLKDRYSHRPIQKDLPGRLNKQQYDAFKAEEDQKGQEPIKDEGGLKGVKIPPHLLKRMAEQKAKKDAKQKEKK